MGLLPLQLAKGVAHMDALDVARLQLAGLQRTQRGFAGHVRNVLAVA